MSTAHATLVDHLRRIDAEIARARSGIDAIEAIAREIRAEILGAGETPRRGADYVLVADPPNGLAIFGVAPPPGAAP